MSVAKVLELSARSPESFEAAIEEGVAKAGESLRNVREAWVKEQKVILDDSGAIAEYQVGLMISFVVE